MVHHARAGVSHDSLDLSSHGWIITVNCASGASRLAFLKRALCQTLPCVIEKSLTIFAGQTIGIVLITTINPDHRLDGLVFSSYPWTGS